MFSNETKVWFDINVYYPAINWWRDYGFDLEGFLFVVIFVGGTLVWIAHWYMHFKIKYFAQQVRERVAVEGKYEVLQSCKTAREIDFVQKAMDHEW